MAEGQSVSWLGGLSCHGWDWAVCAVASFSPTPSRRLADPSSVVGGEWLRGCLQEEKRGGKGRDVVTSKTRVCAHNLGRDLQMATWEILLLTDESRRRLRVRKSTTTSQDELHIVTAGGDDKQTCKKGKAGALGWLG